MIRAPRENTGGVLRRTGALGLDNEEWYLQSESPRTSKVEATFPLANTEVRVRHRLGKRARAFRVLSKTAVADIYLSATKADKWFIYLKSSVGGVTVSLEVL